jgi:hypothetical protein
VGPGGTCSRSGLVSSLLGLALLAGCTSADEAPTSPPAASLSPSATLTPPRTPRPTPTPQPTPRFTNEPDPELAALLPTTAGGVTLTVPPVTEFALTPGDLVDAFGELANRFSALAVGFARTPRTTLYAVRVEGEPIATADLEPHLATAGRFVGIAGLDRESWQPAVVAGNQVWVRGEDNATAAGTMIYTWSSGEFVFLLIGVDDAVNQAIVAGLPGEPAPTPTPVPSPSTPGAPGGSTPSAEASPTASASP